MDPRVERVLIEGEGEPVLTHMLNDFLADNGIAEALEGETLSPATLLLSVLARGIVLCAADRDRALGALKEAGAPDALIERRVAEGLRWWRNHPDMEVEV